MQCASFSLFGAVVSQYGAFLAETSKLNVVCRDWHPKQFMIQFLEDANDGSKCSLRCVDADSYQLHSDPPPGDGRFGWAACLSYLFSSHEKEACWHAAMFILSVCRDTKGQSLLESKFQYKDLTQHKLHQNNLKLDFLIASARKGRICDSDTYVADSDIDVAVSNLMQFRLISIAQVLICLSIGCPFPPSLRSVNLDGKSVVMSFSEMEAISSFQVVHQVFYHFFTQSSTKLKSIHI